MVLQHYKTHYAYALHTGLRRRAHLLPARQAADVGVHGELGLQPKVAAELLNGRHGQRPRLLAHLHASEEGGAD